MTRAPIVLPIEADDRFAGTIRHGWAGAHPIHAAACAWCWEARYDTPTFGDAAAWLASHLTEVHGARRIVVAPAWWRMVRRGDRPTVRPLVAALDAGWAQGVMTPAHAA